MLTGGAAGAAGLLAGCTSGGSDDPTEADGTGETPTDGEGTPTESRERTVEMAPTGEVTLEAVPGSVANYFPGYADMAVAPGHGDALNSVGVVDRYHTDHYEELDGVSVDKESMTELVTDSGIDKEVFYDLDSDLHLIDPGWLVNNGFFGLEADDVDELSANVALFLVDILPALKGEDSPTGSSRLRVSSGVKYAFASSRHRSPPNCDRGRAFQRA